MRVITLIALVTIGALAAFAQFCEGGSLRGQPSADEEEDFHPRRLYRDYGLMRRSARADDSFDDYGHLRFGRSDD